MFTELLYSEDNIKWLLNNTDFFTCGNSSLRFTSTELQQCNLLLAIFLLMQPTLALVLLLPHYPVDLCSLWSTRVPRCFLYIFLPSLALLILIFPFCDIEFSCLNMGLHIFPYWNLSALALFSNLLRSGIKLDVYLKYFVPPFSLKGPKVAYIIKKQYLKAKNSKYTNIKN